MRPYTYCCRVDIVSCGVLWCFVSVNFEHFPHLRNRQEWLRLGSTQTTGSTLDPLTVADSGRAQRVTRHPGPLWRWPLLPPRVLLLLFLPAPPPPPPRSPFYCHPFWSTSRQVGVVEQEPVLFGGSVADNICYGRPGASREDVEAAAAVANASGFIQVRCGTVSVPHARQ